MTPQGQSPGQRPYHIDMSQSHEPSPKAGSPLSHIDEAGLARMVDVGDKPATERVAIAEARVQVSEQLAEQIRANTLAKGNLLEVVKLAGIQAAKRTSDLIPLCHPLPLDVVHVSAVLDGQTITIRAQAKTTAKTGVEMEALTAAAVAALTVIDMGKAVDKGIVIESIRILEKRGGRSGHYIADPEPPR